MIRIQQVKTEEKELLWNIMQKYLYEMTKYYPDELDKYGEYQYKYFDEYFIEPKRKAYFFYNDESIVGFAMINPYSYINHQPDNVLAEFTVFPSFRRKHIASQAAQTLIDAHPGKWEIKFHEKNVGAKQFWESLTQKYHPTIHDIGDEETVLEFGNRNDNCNIPGLDEKL